MQDVFQSLFLSICYCVCVCAALSTRFKCCSCESRKFRVVLAKFTLLLLLLLLLVMLVGNLFLWHFACANGSAILFSPPLSHLAFTVTLFLSLFTFFSSLLVLDRDLPKSLWHNTSKATCCRLSLSSLLSLSLFLIPVPSNKSE